MSCTLALAHESVVVIVCCLFLYNFVFSYIQTIIKLCRILLILQVGYDMSKKAADQAYRKSGLSPSDVQVVELHDCFSANELISYEALGLCPQGMYQLGLASSDYSLS